MWLINSVIPTLFIYFLFFFFFLFYFCWGGGLHVGASTLSSIYEARKQRAASHASNLFAPSKWWLAFPFLSLFLFFILTCHHHPPPPRGCAVTHIMYNSLPIAQWLVDSSRCGSIETKQRVRGPIALFHLFARNPHLLCILLAWAEFYQDRFQGFFLLPRACLTKYLHTLNLKNK